MQDNILLCKDLSNSKCQVITDITCRNSADYSCKIRNTNTECSISTTKICKTPIDNNEYIESSTG